MKTRATRYMIFMTFLTMFCLAVTDGSRGILIPTFKSVFSVNDTAIGLLLTFSSLAYLVASYFGSLLCQHFGQKKVILLGIMFSGIGFLIASKIYLFYHLIFCYVFINFGFGLMGIGMNTLVPLIPVVYLGLLMNLLHFFYGLGSTFTQRLTGYLLYLGIHWRNIFTAFFIVYIALFFLYFLVKIPQDHSATSPRKGTIERPRLLFAFCLCLGFYVAAEMQTANWLFNYFKMALSLDVNTGSLFVALFFGAFSVGRLGGAFLVEKFGYMRSVFVSLSLSFILYTTGLLMGSSGVGVIAFSGLFFGITFPTLILVIQQTFPKKGTYIAGLATMSASLISMITGALMGFFNDHFGEAITIYTIPVVLAGAVLSIGLIRKWTDKTQND